MVGWKIAQPGESIPYESVFISAEPLTDADIQRANHFSLNKLPHSELRQSD
jgi:hypothetical protein